MKKHFLISSSLSALAGLLLVAPALLHADPLADLAGFSPALDKIDKAKLEKGEIISKHSGNLSSVRAQGVESAFLVDAPLEKTVDSLREWNGSQHSDLKIYLHEDINGGPGPASFKRLASAPSNDVVHAFVAETQKLGTGASDLQLNSAEVQPVAAGGGGTVPPGVVNFWSAVLEKRVRAYLSGGLPALPPYTVGGQKISAAEEAAALLSRQPKIQARFAGILGAAGISGKPNGKVSIYWELLHSQGEGGTSLAAISLGASLVNSNGKDAQAIDLQYYSTGNYYTMITLYQLWPMDVGAKHETLVWRGDLLSSGDFATLKGIERNAAGSILAKELAPVMAYFQKDTAGH